jgi:hypothetical protein
MRPAAGATCAGRAAAINHSISCVHAALRICRFRGKLSRAAHVAAIMPPPAAISTPCIFPDLCGRRQGALPPIARCGWPNRTLTASLPFLYLMPPRAEPGSQHEVHATAPNDAQARVDVFFIIILRWSPPRTRWRLPPPRVCMAPRVLDKTVARGYTTATYRLSHFFLQFSCHYGHKAHDGLRSRRHEKCRRTHGITCQLHGQG